MTDRMKVLFVDYYDIYGTDNILKFRIRSCIDKCMYMVPGGY